MPSVHGRVVFHDWCAQLQREQPSVCILDLPPSGYYSMLMMTAAGAFRAPMDNPHGVRPVVGKVSLPQPPLGDPSDNLD